MKLLKQTDLVLQVLITLVCIILGIVKDDFQIILYLYFILGGWQIFSFVTHFLIDPGWANKGERGSYGMTILWIVIVGALCYLFLLAEKPLLFFYLGAMLFVSPVLACWYFIISIKEWRNLRHRELIHLK